MSTFGPDYFDLLERNMKAESNDRLAEIVREGISVTLPHEAGTSTRMPTERQMQEAYFATRELERRVGGEPEPVPMYEDWSDIPEFHVAVEADRAPKSSVPAERKRPANPRKRKPKVEVTVPEEKLPAPEWWDDEPKPEGTFPLDEVVEVELPTGKTLAQLEKQILDGMPRRVSDRWQIPDARELAEAKAALTVLVERAKKKKKA
jgi:hypothetical protein